MPNAFVIDNGFNSLSSSTITGSLLVTGGITGSLLGTSSWATNAITASFIQDNITGSGTANYIPKFTGVYSLGSSLLYDNGTSVGINLTNPNASYTLDVNGSTKVGQNLLVGAGIYSSSPAYISTRQGKTVATNALVLASQETGSPFPTDLIFKTEGATVGWSLQSTNQGVGRTTIYLNPLGGNVAIGTLTDDGNRLQVVGSGRFSSGLTVTGSLIAPSITGSLQGTASYAITASYALNAGSGGGGGGATNQITSGSVTASVSPVSGFVVNANSTITGSLNVTGNITSSVAVISGSGVQRLTIIGSGSTAPIFTVQGSQGELFSVTDSLSGSLFSVNDISGLPILEVFSDSTTLIGNYNSPALYTTNKILSSVVGANLIYSLATASYDGVFIDYVIKSGSNARAGNFTALWSGTSVNYMDNSTTDFGTTTGFTFAANIIGGNMVVSGSGTTAGWKIETIIKAI